MTHFGIIVSIMSTMLGTLVLILGALWKASAAWERMKGAVKGLTEDVMEINKKLIDSITGSTVEHDRFEERLRAVEISEARKS